ncbi:MAG: hypothetical protein JRF72_13135, partial [Deltaproteobacteria bacterium]|nr:hypothetical protein [Deltaproteobacteria bacterium]
MGIDHTVRATVLLLLTLLSYAVRSDSAETVHIPTTYAGLYNRLDRILDEQLQIEARVKTKPGQYSPMLCTDLLVANSNRGEVLLNPQTMQAVTTCLDSFRELGVGCVKFAVQYPLLTPDFPRNEEYVAFYRQVVTEAHKRGIKLMPHVSVIFADTPFSQMKGIYRGLTLARFKSEYRLMVMRVANELKPDYLDLLTEPDTHAKLTGLRELNQPAVIADVVQNALRGWDHKGILLGAGSGSWSSTDFAQAFVAIPELDYLAIHVYPVNARFLDNARQMARIAHAAGKQCFIDESWLYKTERPGGGDNVAASANIFRRDVFSFWQPLDSKFMTLMYDLACHEQVSLLY